MATGFNAHLITMTAGQPMVAADMNANFSALNTALVFTGAVVTLNSDGGKLTSDNASGNPGNLLVGGGKLGVVAPGDRIDAGSVPGSLFLTGGQSIVLSTAGIVCTTISSDGVAQGGNEPVRFSNLGIGSNADTGFLQLSSTFAGIGGGIYNHGLGDLPDWAMPVQNVSIGNGYTRVAVQNNTSSSITVVLGTDNPFICWCILYQ